MYLSAMRCILPTLLVSSLSIAAARSVFVIASAVCRARSDSVASALPVGGVGSAALSASFCCAAVVAVGCVSASAATSASAAAPTASSTASSIAWVVSSGTTGGVVSVRSVTVVSPGTPCSAPKVARVPPPIRPPAIAASRYSAMASSLSIGSPA